MAASVRFPLQIFPPHLVGLAGSLYHFWGRENSSQKQRAKGSEVGYSCRCQHGFILHAWQHSLRQYLEFLIIKAVVWVLAVHQLKVGKYQPERPSVPGNPLG